ncbi:hypothetical protein HK100_012448 [Physocladia obscura]|uniref:Cryptic loci regulator 2 N-terminal domain-containing protein n=1 Tax=Physocladia obscura TaxID=109957 RepID=A0AAD5T0B8_9FUNG|nr:hypothetical protein HK100_012448 [Physocladia obscura]
MWSDGTGFVPVSSTSTSSASNGAVNANSPNGSWFAADAETLRRFGQQIAASIRKGPDAFVFAPDDSDNPDNPLPKGYVLMCFQRSGPSKHVDRYLFGHPSGLRFRSTKEFVPHLRWLAVSRASGAACECILCTKKPSSNPASRTASASPFSSAAASASSLSKPKRIRSAPSVDSDSDTNTNSSPAKKKPNTVSTLPVKQIVQNPNSNPPSASPTSEEIIAPNKPAEQSAVQKTKSGTLPNPLSKTQAKTYQSTQSQPPQSTSQSQILLKNIAPITLLQSAPTPMPFSNFSKVTAETQKAEKTLAQAKEMLEKSIAFSATKTPDANLVRKIHELETFLLESRKYTMPLALQPKTVDPKTTKAPTSTVSVTVNPAPLKVEDTMADNANSPNGVDSIKSKEQPLSATKKPSNLASMDPGQQFVQQQKINKVFGQLKVATTRIGEVQAVLADEAISPENRELYSRKLKNLEEFQQDCLKYLAAWRKNGLIPITDENDGISGVGNASEPSNASALAISATLSTADITASTGEVPPPVLPSNSQIHMQPNQQKIIEKLLPAFSTKVTPFENPLAPAVAPVLITKQSEPAKVIESITVPMDLDRLIPAVVPNFKKPDDAILSSIAEVKSAVANVAEKARENKSKALNLTTTISNTPQLLLPSKGPQDSLVIAKAPVTNSNHLQVSTPLSGVTPSIATALPTITGPAPWGKAVAGKPQTTFASKKPAKHHRVMIVPQNPQQSQSKPLHQIDPVKLLPGPVLTPTFRVNELVYVEALLFKSSRSTRTIESFPPAPGSNSNTSVSIETSKIYEKGCVFWPAIIDTVYSESTQNHLWTTPILIESIADPLQQQTSSSKNTAVFGGGKELINVSTAASFPDSSFIVENGTTARRRVSYRVRLLCVRNGVLPLPEIYLVPARHVQVPDGIVPAGLTDAMIDAVCINDKNNGNGVSVPYSAFNSSAEGVSVLGGFDVVIVSYMKALLIARTIFNNSIAGGVDGRGVYYQNIGSDSLLLGGEVVRTGDFVAVKGVNNAKKICILRVSGWGVSNNGSNDPAATPAVAPNPSTAAAGSGMWIEGRLSARREGKSLAKAQQAARAAAAGKRVAGVYINGESEDAEFERRCYRYGGVVRVSVNDFVGRIYATFPIVARDDEGRIFVAKKTAKVI